MPYYYFDWTYLVLVLPCVIIAMWASANVNSTLTAIPSNIPSAASPERRQRSGCCLPTAFPAYGSSGSEAI